MELSENLIKALRERDPATLTKEDWDGLRERTARLRKACDEVDFIADQYSMGARDVH